MSQYFCYTSAFRRRTHHVFGLSVRPSIRPKPEIPSFHLHMGFRAFAAWREWPEIWHADVSWPPTELIRIWLWSVNCPYFGTICLTGIGQVWAFRAFPGEPIEEMVCWCILTTCKKFKFMVMAGRFSKCWHYFDWLKRVKFLVSEHFSENACREWPGISLPWLIMYIVKYHPALFPLLQASFSINCQTIFPIFCP